MFINASLIVQMIVFLLLVGFTMKFVWPPITKALDERAAKIRDGLSAADKAKAELAGAEAQIAKELAATKAESGKLISDAEKRAAAIVDAAKGKAEEEGAKILAAAKADAEQQVFPRSRSPARASRRSGRQGRRADPAEGSQRRRPRRAAGSPEDGAVNG